MHGLIMKLADYCVETRSLKARTLNSLCMVWKKVLHVPCCYSLKRILASYSYAPVTNYLIALDYGNDDGVQYTCAPPRWTQCPF